MSKIKPMNKRQIAAHMKRAEKMHRAWHKFSKFLNDNWNGDLAGYEVMQLIEGYAKENKDIKIAYCDDDHFCSAMLVIIPHKNMGNTVMFIPQCTTTTNTFFLYPNHQKMLIEKLNEVTHEGPMEKYLKKLNSEPNDAECDARKDDQGTERP